MKSIKSKGMLASLLLVPAFISLVNCSSGSSSSSDETTSGAPTLSSVSDLPQATAPVIGSDSNIAALVSPRLATTGVVLNDLSGADFNEESSMAMCEMSQVMKGMFREASMGDTILCYIGQMFDEASIAANADLEGIDIYDGEPHVFDLNMVNDAFAEEDEDAGTFRVRFQITKDENGSITDFKLQTCTGETQEQYLHQTISGSTFTMTNIEVFDDDWGTGGQQMTVTGTLNDEGQFTSKTMTSTYNHTSDQNSGYGQRVLVQGADSATVSQVDNGTWTWSNGEETEEGTYSNHIYAYGEILNADDLATLALGDGVAFGDFAGTCCGSESYSHEFEEGWDGDTTLSAEHDDLMALIADEALPEDIDEPTVAFTGDQAYDCSGDAIEITVDVGEVDAACNGSMNYEWVNCYDIIENGNAPEEDEGGEGEGA